MLLPAFTAWYVCCHLLKRWRRDEVETRNFTNTAVLVFRTGSWLVEATTPTFVRVLVVGSVLFCWNYGAPQPSCTRQICTGGLKFLLSMILRS